MFIKALPPKNPIQTWTYTRYGVVIPKEEIEIENLKELFSNSPLSEEKLLQTFKDDIRISITNKSEKEIIEEKEKIENKVGIELEKKIKKDDKKRALQKKIDDFNERKEQAIETETKEDDIAIAKEEKELEKEIKEANNGKE